MPRECGAARARADRTLSSHCSGEDSPSSTRRRPVVTGASMPWRSNAIGEQRHRGERLGGLVHRRLAPARPALRRRPSRPRAGCGCPRRGRWPRGRPRRRGRRRSRCGRRWRAPARGSRRRRARRRRRRGSRRAARLRRLARAAAFFAQAASSAPVTSSVASTVRPPASSRSRSWRRRSASLRGEHDRGAELDRLARVRGTGERGHRARPHALGDVGGRRGAERRHEALRGHQHGGAVAHARADLADGGGQARARHGEHHEVHAGELDLGHGLHVDGAVELRARAGSACSRASARSALGLGAGAAAELHLRRPARASTIAAAVPIEPAPTTAAVRSGGRPPSHSHWSSTHGQMRSVTSPARNGEGSSTRGKVSGGPQRMCTFTGLIRQPLRACSEFVTAIGTTGLPLWSARRPTPRLGRAERAGADAGALGEDHDGLAALEQRAGGVHRLLVGRAALDREGAEAVEDPAEQRVLEQLLLGHEVDRPAEAAADRERVEEAAVVRREDHAAVRDVLGAEPPEAEVDEDRRLQRSSAAASTRASSRRGGACARGSASGGVGPSTRRTRVGPLALRCAAWSFGEHSTAPWQGQRRRRRGPPSSRSTSGSSDPATTTWSCSASS